MLSWPSWLTYSGWLTHISGHPSAAGRAQDGESSPARDRRSTIVLRHQHGGVSMRKLGVKSFVELVTSQFVGESWKRYETVIVVSCVRKDFCLRRKYLYFNDIYSVDDFSFSSFQNFTFLQPMETCMYF